MVAYLRLFRWPNLLMVAAIQYLFRYAIIQPLLKSKGLELALSHGEFFLIVLATMLITAAGYAINDYFDLRTDRINKPHRIILGRKISRRSAIFYHSLFNIIAVLLGAYMAIRVQYWPLGFVFLIVPTLLWLYSIRYKRKFLMGNVIVAVLAGFVVAIVWVFESHALAAEGVRDFDFLNISYFSRVYALFAFLTTLLREIIKDIEDIKGDAKTGCKTIPVLAGVHSTKKLLIFLTITIIILVGWFQIFILLRDFDLLFAYLLLAVQIPFIIMINKIMTAKEKADYRNLSHFSKWIMVAGIFSMFIFSFYLQGGFPLE
ncbi:MAG: geranylgeranylglycerol-phosphate geranylgeranyltransferase [Bacteroidales bacterium]|nr:geranylgeranylglycerol-phosphate geranylgeranyltransferase [Bacteroidales bacterium]